MGAAAGALLMWHHCVLQSVVCCNPLQGVAVCCSVLQYSTAYCSVLQVVAVCYSVLQCATVCYSVLQCATVCCSVLQSAAICCSARSMLQCAQYVAVRAVCCSKGTPFMVQPFHDCPLNHLIQTEYTN